MRFRLYIVAALLLLIFASACFDLETEVLFLEDGSGFVTQWARLDSADVIAAAALNGSNVADWTNQVLAGLESTFTDVPGIELVNHDVEEIAGKLVLRYRFTFTNTAALNAFLADPMLEQQLIFPAAGRFATRIIPTQCGNSYQADFSFSPRSAANIERFNFDDLDRLPPEQKQPLIEKFYSGKMLLRLVLPGQIKAHDAPRADGNGFPIYESTVLDFFRNGKKGVAKSETNLKCKQNDNAEKKKEKDVPYVTIGQAPTPNEMITAARGMAHYTDLLLEYDCDDRGRVKIAVTYMIKSPMQGPFEFMFPLLFAGFPKMETEYEMKLSQLGPGLYRYRFELKKPINPTKLEGHYIYFAKQKGYYAFRLNLPKMNFGESFLPGQAETAMVRVQVKMPEKIRVTNATEMNEKTATWVLTDKMMYENRITLEALTE